MCGAFQARILEWAVISFLTCKSRSLEPMHLRGMRKAGVGPSGRDFRMQLAASLVTLGEGSSWLAGQLGGCCGSPSRGGECCCGLGGGRIEARNNLSKQIRNKQTRLQKTLGWSSVSPQRPRSRQDMLLKRHVDSCSRPQTCSPRQRGRAEPPACQSPLPSQIWCSGCESPVTADTGPSPSHKPRRWLL